jgi:hypothetical protein
LPVGGFELSQLVAWGLGNSRQKFFGDTSADFLYGKNFMALYVKPVFPYKSW